MTITNILLDYEEKRLTQRFTVAYNLVRTSGCSSVVERMLPKHDIVGSNPITRSKNEWIGYKHRQIPPKTAERRCFVSPKTQYNKNGFLPPWLSLTPILTLF
jgi:hypothetical protein